ncbi:dihydropteroate synthase [Catenovulum maritimum]|uniref:Dihydropteroate synthase n=1 Tax=Catenovulum maritimum TaxID=1513271 RepID=A0A0J8GMN9_9ALTE|nr:dihydropteroate synthase [Catenovulum maritimum]KMT64042.1 dihydropteroate synthase [Catenovulum maritimum]
MKIQKLLAQKQGPLVMGIVNVTPDSFSDGGRYNSVESAIEQVAHMVELGVDIVDVGGESTRPGAAKVGLNEEAERVLPVVQAIKNRFDVAISVDTYKPELMAEALKLHVDMVNDVKALTMPNAVEILADTDAYICLMHMQGTPQTMQSDPKYTDAINEIINYLDQRLTVCNQAGINNDRICIDPGFGFGKTLEHNYQILNQLDKFNQLNVNVLAGLSRKTMIGAVTGKEPEQRVYGSVAGAVIAAMKGAKIIRVHDVDATIDALKVLNATISTETENK